MIGQTTTDDAPLPSADRDAPIMSAGRTIDQLYQRDNQYPDLADLLRGKPFSISYATKTRHALVQSA